MMRLGYTILLLLASCKRDAHDIKNLNGNRIDIIGHGGMGIYYTLPMNSFESLSHALYMGADGVEIDVQMTTDSVLVAFHDPELSNRTHADGKIYEKKWSDLEDVAYRQPVMGNYKLTSLERFFQGNTGFRDKIYAFDCKNFNPDTSRAYAERFCRALLRITDRYGLPNALFEIKREDVIVTMKRMRPAQKIYVYSDPENGLRLCRKYQLDGIVWVLDEISKEQVKAAHDEGYRVIILNAHSVKRNREAVDKNPDMIETDNLNHLLRILE